MTPKANRERLTDEWKANDLIVLEESVVDKFLSNDHLYLFFTPEKKNFSSFSGAWLWHLA